jgi:hypothetical protein
MPVEDACDGRAGSDEPVDGRVDGDQVTAPMIPPISEVSLPMTAFCATLDSRKITTKSNVFMLASPCFPVSRNSTASSPYTMTVRRILSASGICG